MITFKENSWFDSTDSDSNLHEINSFLQKRKRLEIFDISFFNENEKKIFLHFHHLLYYALEGLCRQYDVTEKIRLVWTTGLNLNAVATSQLNDGCYYIGINIGTVAILQNFFHSLFAYKKFLPGLGKSHLEVGPKASIIRETKNITADFCTPKCELRAHVAHLMTGYGLMYILMHECTHIFNGHTGNLELIEEIHSEEIASFDTIKKHTLEMDADSGAVIMLFNRLYDLYFSSKCMNLPSTEKAIQSFFGHSAKGNVDFVSLIISSVYFLFNQKILNCDEMYSDSHPHPALRKHMAIYVLSSHAIRDHPSLTQEIIQETAFPNLRKVCEASDYLKHEEFAQSLRIFFESDNFFAYTKCLLRCWSDECFTILNSAKLTTRKVAPPQY